MVPTHTEGEALQQNATRKATVRPASWWYQAAYHIAMALAENKPVPTQQKLADLCGVHRVTLARAVSRPEMQTWLSREIRQHAGLDDAIGDRIRLRVAGKAMAGDLDAARLFFQVTGQLGPKEGVGFDGGPTVNVQVNVRV